MTDMLEKVKSALGGKYDIVSKISEGGMGVIYLGTHRALNRQVAVKIIHQQFCQDQVVRERFSREAKLAANLNYPGIVEIYDFGSEDAFDYIIMRYIKGETLAQTLKREGGIPCPEAVGIILAVAKALSHAHKRNVVHRDIKPSNIMIDENRQVILTDFGISKDLGDSQLTAADTVIGSPKYMSPEQIRGGRVDGRSDLYALGLIFYEMVTRKHPFEGRDTTALYYAQVHETPPRPENVSTGLPPAVGSIVMKLLSKSPDERFQNGDELIRDLGACSMDTRGPAATDSDATMMEFSVPDDATRMDGMPAPKAPKGPIPPSPPAAKPDGTARPALLNKFLGGKKVPAVTVGAVLLLILLMAVFRSGNKQTAPETAQNPPAAETRAPQGEASQSTVSLSPASASKVTAPGAAVPSTETAASPEPVSTYDRILKQLGELTQLSAASYVKLSTNKPSFRVGDEITYSFESQKQCYLILLNQTSDGELVQIYPNKSHASPFIQANTSYTIPGKDEEISLEVTGPAGQDHLIALTSDAPFEIFHVDFERYAFAQLDRNDVLSQETILKNLSALKSAGVSQMKYSYAIEQ